MPEKVEWLPILAKLGEKVVARIIENSPDAQSAILRAQAEYQAAEEEAVALRKLGHEESKS